LFLVFTVYSIALDRIEEVTELLQKSLLQKFPKSEKIINSTTQQFLTESLSAATQQLKKHVSVRTLLYFCLTVVWTKSLNNSHVSD
jgi:hypothetical protein